MGLRTANMAMIDVPEVDPFSCGVCSVGSQSMFLIRPALWYSDKDG